MEHWEKQARLWALLDAPLKPSPIDIQNLQAWINESITDDDFFNVLILGVTPELVRITWPKNTKLYAIDLHLSMLQSILPTDTAIKPIAISGDWLELPFVHSSMNLVVGDGCYSSLRVHDYAQMNKEIQRVLKPSGQLMVRFFSKLDLHQSRNQALANLHQAIATKKINNFHAFKLQLAMALHDDLLSGVRLGEVWNCWNDQFKTKINKLKQELNWNDEVIATIDNYKDSIVVYTFPSLSEIRKSLSMVFTEQQIFMPSYALGSACPTLQLKSNRDIKHVISSCSTKFLPSETYYQSRFI
jgi:hypothetical protein